MTRRVCRPPRALLTLVLALAGCACDSAHPPTKPTPAELLQKRPYALRVPPVPRSPAPLVIALHGQCGSGAGVTGAFHLDTAADTEGFLLAAPDGELNVGGCPFWNPTGSGRWPYDEDYLAAIIADVKAKQAVDERRVFFFGYSLGAFMAQRMGCVLAGEVTGVASVAGLVSLAPGVCAPTRPVTALLLHGDLDTVITYDGSPFIGDPPRKSSPSAHDSANFWATHDGCAGPVAPTGQTLDLDTELPGEETLVEAAPECAEGSAVELWTLRGAGHGPAVADDVGLRVLRFLEAHPGP